MAVVFDFFLPFFDFAADFASFEAETFFRPGFRSSTEVLADTSAGDAIADEVSDSFMPSALVSLTIVSATTVIDDSAACWAA